MPSNERVKEKTKIKMMTDIIESIQIFENELSSWNAGSERAGRRARVASSNLDKLLKEFRRFSMKITLDDERF